MYVECVLCVKCECVQCVVCVSAVCVCGFYFLMEGVACRGLRTTRSNASFPPTERAPEAELESSGLAAAPLPTDHLAGPWSRITKVLHTPTSVPRV